jgi:hypothetical protein
MVIYFAIKEVYEGDVPDRTCAELVQQIGQNCPAIVVDMKVKERYDQHLMGLFRQPRYQTQTALFLANVVYNPSKFVIETSEPAGLPPSVIGDIPQEDRYIVCAGLISYPIIVTAEQGLRNAINKHREALRLTAITPAEALRLAKAQWKN